jgi:dihydroneopterin aldolase
MSSLPMPTASSAQSLVDADTVHLKNIQVDTLIGIYDWERGIRQKVVIDLEMGTDNWAVASTDSLEGAVDYDAVCRRVIKLVQAAEFRMIETLAERIADCVLAEFNLPWISVHVAKPGATPGDLQGVKVGVSIFRRAEELN